VRSDREEKKVVNAAFQSMIDATIWLFVGLEIFNAVIFASIYKALRRKKYGDSVSGGGNDGYIWTPSRFASIPFSGERYDCVYISGL
jgi:hypothetical protein